MEFERGLFTAFLEASATAIGVGMVLGGFAVGLLGTLSGATRDELEAKVLRGGYLGAAFCLASRMVDLATI